MQTTGNTILITGGSAGIGLALAEKLMRQSNRVIACGRSAARLDAARASLPDLHTLVCDLTDAEQRRALAEHVRANYPDLNVLVNNAGVQYTHLDFGTGGATNGCIGNEIDTNLTALVCLTDDLLPVLRRQPQAAVVNISSALALVPRADLPVYCATKAAVHAFSLALRRQLAATPVRVYEVLPPQVNTGLNPAANTSRASAMSPAAVADAVLAGLARDRYEIKIGITGTLAAINRWLPGVAAALINR
ncbi:MAG: SDR family NAD(P)-dependent oxidoreductase [Anaerolineae bacterium]|nr:SDR family NAD(P)-dependent oxidoreductase [Anaerolineae bacterium]